MPRLRYKKSYDFTLYEDKDEEEDQENEPITGNSWLSNAAIASQLSESRIKTAIQALKAQIAVLENELLSRRLTRSYETHTNWDKIGQPRKRKDGAGHKNSPVGRSVKRDYQFQKITKTLKKLGIKNIPALLEQWQIITEKAENKKEK